ncbi:hypothetical protein ACPPVT_03945 [Angustibacter sp. McL0619]|uniref:hypothetical protein n=1 Tax=Angustibacter sp. McL0619 TaxID=3415676 RepID=UPI003CE7F56D
MSLVLALPAAMLAALLSSAPAVTQPAVTQPAPAPSGRVVTVTDPRITESSGLAVSPVHPDLVWTVNDSGSEPQLFAVSTRTGRTRAVVRLAGIDVRDVEALAAGRDERHRPMIWVGDIGDNRAVRDSVVLRLLREPDQVRSQTAAVHSLRVRYPRGPADAETLVWLPDGRLLIVTKALLSARVYQVPASAVSQVLAGRDVSIPVVAQQVGTIAQTLATDGSALPDGRFVVRGYESATVYAWHGGASDSASDSGSDSGFEPVEPVALPTQQQGEGITVEAGGGTALVSSEGLRQPLYRVALPGPTGSVPTTPVPISPVPTSPGPSGSASQPGSTPTRAGASSDSAGRQWGAPALLGGGALAAALALGALAVRGARRRTRRSR